MSIYEVHDRRVVRSIMYHLDTASLLDFLRRQAAGAPKVTDAV